MARDLAKFLVRRSRGEAPGKVAMVLSYAHQCG